MDGSDADVRCSSDFRRHIQAQARAHDCVGSVVFWIIAFAGDETVTSIIDYTVTDQTGSYQDMQRCGVPPDAGVEGIGVA